MDFAPDKAMALHQLLCCCRQSPRSTCDAQWRGRTRRTRSWQSTSAGRWTETPGWSLRSRQSTCAQEAPPPGQDTMPQYGQSGPPRHTIQPSPMLASWHAPETLNSARATGAEPALCSMRSDWQALAPCCNEHMGVWEGRAHLDLHGGRCARGDLLVHPVSNAREHCGACMHNSHTSSNIAKTVLCTFSNTSIKCPDKVSPTHP